MPGPPQGLPRHGLVWPLEQPYVGGTVISPFTAKKTEAREGEWFVHGHPAREGLSTEWGPPGSEPELSALCFGGLLLRGEACEGFDSRDPDLGRRGREEVLGGPEESPDTTTDVFAACARMGPLLCITCVSCPLPLGLRTVPTAPELANWAGSLEHCGHRWPMREEPLGQRHWCWQWVPSSPVWAGALWVTHIPLVFMLLRVPGLDTEDSQDILNTSFPPRSPRSNRRGHGTIESVCCVVTTVEAMTFWYLGCEVDLRDLLLICFD